MWRRVGAALFLLTLLMALTQPAERAGAVAYRLQTDRADVGRATLSSEQRSRSRAQADGSEVKRSNIRIFDTADSPFDPESANQGWWSDTIDAGFRNTNYIAGVCCGGDHRNFFTFDLRTLHRRVVSATLRVNSGDVAGDETETLQLSDVCTDAKTLNFNTLRNPKVFRDLGTGVVYGTYVVSSDQDNVTLELELNRAAIRDLNRARGDFFSIGGRLTSLSGDNRDEFIFGNSGNTSDDTVQLVTRTRRR